MKVKVTRSDVYAARLVVECNRQLGRETPQWVKTLAAVNLRPLLTVDDLQQSKPQARSVCGTTKRSLARARARLIAALERGEP